MAQESLFGLSRPIHWPSEFGDLVNMMKGQSPNGSPSHTPMYTYNTGPILIAAILGITHQREREVGPQKQEISTDVFERQRIGNSNLASFVLLIPLIGSGDLELLRPEREEELIRRFERYVAGGFEYLRGAMSHSSDSTGQAVLRTEIQQALVAQPRMMAMVGITADEDLTI